MRLQGKVAVVTGSSSGMGREIALLFAKEGAHVIAVARRKDRLEELVEKAADFEGTILPFVGDISLREVNDAMIDLAIEKFGKLDILVNNAGMMDEFLPVGELSDEHWNKIMAVNLFGPMTAIRKAVQVMSGQEKGGNIVNIASVGGLHGCRSGAAYAASKAALINLSANTAFVYAPQNIRSNCICPGGVNTEVGVNITNPSPLGFGRAKLGMGAMPRMGEACEIASVALFLASEEASFVNGIAVPVDAGWTAY